MTSFEPESTPPATPYARRAASFRRESFLPPRALPSLGAASSLIAAAAGAAGLETNPTRRVLLTLACGVVTWLVGYFTPPPRRRFRRDDR